MWVHTPKQWHDQHSYSGYISKSTSQSCRQSTIIIIHCTYLLILREYNSISYLVKEDFIFKTSFCSLMESRILSTRSSLWDELTYSSSS